MELIDNINALLGENLKGLLQGSDSRFSGEVRVCFTRRAAKADPRQTFGCFRRKAEAEQISQPVACDVETRPNHC